jgi:hypothetical protein
MVTLLAWGAGIGSNGLEGMCRVAGGGGLTIVRMSRVVRFSTVYSMSRAGTQSGALQRSSPLSQIFESISVVPRPSGMDQVGPYVYQLAQAGGNCFPAHPRRLAPIAQPCSRVHHRREPM